MSFSCWGGLGWIMAIFLSDLDVFLVLFMHCFLRSRCSHRVHRYKSRLSRWDSGVSDLTHFQVLVSGSLVLLLEPNKSGLWGEMWRTCRFIQGKVNKDDEDSSSLRSASVQYLLWSGEGRREPETAPVLREALRILLAANLKEWMQPWARGLIKTPRRKVFLLCEDEASCSPCDNEGGQLALMRAHEGRHSGESVMLPGDRAKWRARRRCRSKGMKSDSERESLIFRK